MSPHVAHPRGEGPKAKAQGNIGAPNVANSREARPEIGARRPALRVDVVHLRRDAKEIDEGSPVAAMLGTDEEP